MSKKHDFLLLVGTVIFNLLIHGVVIWLAWSFLCKTMAVNDLLPEITLFQAIAIRALILAMASKSFLLIGSKSKIND